MTVNGRGIIDSFVEIKLANRTDFLKVKETLTRIGFANDDTLDQVCYIFHKMGRYYITHYKEMQLLDREKVTVTEFDRSIRNRVAYLLSEWSKEGGSLGVALVNPDQVEGNMAPMSEITVISHRDKGNWKLVPLYAIGQKKEKRYG